MYTTKWIKPQKCSAKEMSDTKDFIQYDSIFMSTKTRKKKDLWWLESEQRLPLRGKNGY